VNRLIYTHRATNIDSIETALHAFGKRLELRAV
jgi:hypothetical protein